MCLANFLKISFVIQTHVFRKLSDLMIEWSEITIWLVITFLWCSRSWSWSDLRSLFKQVILIWSQITFRVILQFFALAFLLVFYITCHALQNSWHVRLYPRQIVVINQLLRFSILKIKEDCDDDECKEWMFFLLVTTIACFGWRYSKSLCGQII